MLSNSITTSEIFYDCLLCFNFSILQICFLETVDWQLADPKQEANSWRKELNQ